MVSTIDKLTTIERPHRSIHENVCETCSSEINKQHLAYNQAIETADKIESWPSTYKGRVPVILGSEKLPVSSDNIKGKEKARRQLFVTAAYLNPECNAIINLEFSTMGGASGNYEYTLWQATGKPCIIRK